jgi:hypothetical protein
MIETFLAIGLLAIATMLLWKLTSTTKRMVELLEKFEAETKIEGEGYYSTCKDYIVSISHGLHELKDSLSQLLSIATKENPAGACFHEYVQKNPMRRRYQHCPLVRQ